MNTTNVPMSLLKAFISKAQIRAMLNGSIGEEGKWFGDKVSELANTFNTMPKTYEQDGMGGKAVAHLHYFIGGMNWYITERDMEEEQLQAFGLADLGQGGELGYISIEELIENGVELDLHWTPKTLDEINEKAI